MKDRREYADGEIVIRRGILKSGCGWRPIVRVNNGPVQRVWSGLMSREDAVREARRFAEEVASQHVGDVEIIDVGEVADD